jgi:MFS family permease
MRNKGWIVTLAGAGVNMALGVLYAWSVFAKQLTEATANGGFGWDKTTASLPYITAIGVFALMMIPAGRLQDRFGPRLAATAGALLAGLGLIVAGFSTAQNVWPAMFGFGLMTGTGMGLGYAAATPAAVKWFPANKKGLITGIVVSGFGLAPVYIAPLTNTLLAQYGVGGAFKFLGLGFAVFAGLLAQLIVNPPSVGGAKPVAGSPAAADGWTDMTRSPRFFVFWLQYACAATAGLMIIGHLSRIVASQSGGAVTLGFVFVAILAVFNALGRIMAGLISDRIGRAPTIALVCATQAGVMLWFPHLASAGAFFMGAALVGFNYGACLSLFPSVTADNWGTKNFGLNYGLMFTAWGVGGVFGPLLAGRIADATGSYALAFQIAAAMLAAAAVLSLGQTVLARRRALSGAV